MPEISKLAKLLLVKPETNASCEWAFSAMKHIENFWQSTQLGKGLTIVLSSKNILKKLTSQTW